MFVPTHRTCNTRSEPSCPRGHWVVPWVEANSLMATNHHSDRDVDSWGDFVGVGQRVYGKPLHLLLSFAVNLKLL